MPRCLISWLQLVDVGNRMEDASEWRGRRSNMQVHIIQYDSLIKEDIIAVCDVIWLFAQLGCLLVNSVVMTFSLLTCLLCREEKSIQMCSFSFKVSIIRVGYKCQKMSCALMCAVEFINGTF